MIGKASGEVNVSYLTAFGLESTSCPQADYQVGLESLNGQISC